MHGFYTEERRLASGISLSTDLAQHIFIRGARGPVVVVTDKPHDLGSITKKQWHVLMRKVERERASTLKASRIAELSNQLIWMQSLTFTIKPLSEYRENSVVFATPVNLIRKPPICSTLYVTQPLKAEHFRFITSWMPENSVVVKYYSSEN